MPLIAKSNTFSLPLTSNARLVHYSLKETPGQTYEELQASTGIRNINTVRDAVRLLIIVSLATMTDIQPRRFRTIQFGAPATVSIEGV